MINFINRKLADGKICFVSLLLLAAGALSAPVLTTKVIETETRKQCLTHDWPADAHQIHVDFCHAYGYEVGKLGPGF